MAQLLELLNQQQEISASLKALLATLPQHKPHLSLLQELCVKGRLDENIVLPLISERYQIPLFTDADDSVQFENTLLAKELYQRHKVLLLKKDEEVLIWTSLFSDFLNLDQVWLNIGYVGKPYMVLSHRMRHLAVQGEMETAVLASEESTSQDQVYHLIEHALELRSSDIHFESSSDGVKIRIRIDGYLRDAGFFSERHQDVVFACAKVMCHMDIAVRRRPQDGYYAYRAKSGKLVDIRASCIPTESGEKLVMRLLEQSPVQHDLRSLGYIPEDVARLQKLAKIPSGLILVVGPTGSGKTTALYSLLHEVNTIEKNIMTVEDPVEYHIDGINQVSIQPQQGLGFSEALKAFLRQDPDIILIGEIRDADTAEIAIKAAMTGHLVLSTIHCTDAFTTLQRLESFGVPRDLLADHLKLVLAQRLVRRTCVQCLGEAQGCPTCQGVGYYGRVPLYEWLQINSILQRHIKSGTVEEYLKDPHASLAYQPYDACAEVLLEQKITQPEEIHAVMHYDPEL